MSARQDDMSPSGNTWLGKTLNKRLDRRIYSFNLVVHLRRVKQLAFFGVSPRPSHCVKQLVAVLGNHLFESRSRCDFAAESR